MVRYLLDIFQCILRYTNRFILNFESCIIYKQYLTYGRFVYILVLIYIMIKYAFFASQTQDLGKNKWKEGSNSILLESFFTLPRLRNTEFCVSVKADCSSFTILLHLCSRQAPNLSITLKFSTFFQIVNWVLVDSILPFLQAVLLLYICTLFTHKGSIKRRA